MVSLSTVLTLGAIATAVLGFYKLGGASGIGSRLGGGFSSLFDSFGTSLNPIQSAIDKNNAENPALNQVLVAQARVEEATSLDPNLAADRFVDPAGRYDPYNPYGDVIIPTATTAPATTAPDNFMDQFSFKDRTSKPTITYGPAPRFAGTLEHIVKQEFQGPQLPSYAGSLDYVFGDSV